MATTCQDIINELQRLLAPVQQAITVNLSANYTAGGTSLTFTDTSANSSNALSILPGTVLSIDLELFYVTGVVSGGTVAVQGGFQGSTNVNHTSGALIWVNRRFTDFECFRQINNVLDEMSGKGLWHLGELTLNYNPVIQAYDLTDANTSVAITGYIGPVALRYKTPFPDRKYPTIPSHAFEVLPMGGTTVDTNFPSGYQLILNGAGYPGQPMIFLFQQAFSHFTGYTDDAQTVAKLASTMNDIPPMGAMLRMVPPREVQRNQPYAQPDGRLAPETPPGAIAGSVNVVRGNYEMRIGQEQDRLKQLISQFRRRR
jgi:hypothetical protein